MAKFRKTGAKTEIAAGKIYKSWTEQNGKENFSISIVADATEGGKSRFVSLNFDEKEAQEIYKWLKIMLD